MPEVDAHARAAVLSRLWGALNREPIPGYRRAGDRVTVPDGRGLTGPAPIPFAPVKSLDLDGIRYDDPAALMVELGQPGLAGELANSVANLALARAAQPPPDGGEPALARARRQRDPLAWFEQSVVDGHPWHPCCRTRLGLSEDEVRAYAPEHRRVVDLAVVRVPAHRWRASDPTREPLLYLHPWQHAHGYPDLAVETTVPARPLLSLRTLALVDDPSHHVKTAVDVQMTSAVRTVSPAAIHNGPLLSRLLAELPTGTLTVMPEVCAGAMLVDGEPSRHLAAVHRRVPKLAPGEVALPFAALAAPSPATGRPIVEELAGADPAGFLARVVDLTVPSLLTLLAGGVALEAHGQNLLLVLRDGAPARLLYRDLGGVRVSPARLRRHGVEAPPLRGDLLTDDPEQLRAKLVASLVSTVLFELVALLGPVGCDPAWAWSRVAGAVDGPDRSAFFGDTLPLKATTAMRLAADPLRDIWAALPNPMAGLR